MARVSRGNGASRQTHTPCNPLDATGGARKIRRMSRPPGLARSNLLAGLAAGWLLAAAAAPAASPSPTPTPVPAPADRPTVKEELKALVQADVKSQGTKPAAAPAPAALASTPGAATAELLATPVPSPTPSPAPASVAAAANQPTVTMPTVEVNKSKITELNRELHEEDLQIAREAKATRSTEVDTALNNPKFSPSILGGNSTQARQALASERVELMEFEKSLLEAIKQARTAQEKAELKEQLDGVRQMRRELDAPR